MKFQKNILWIALFCIAFMLYNAWVEDHTPPATLQAQSTASIAAPKQSGQALPDTTQASSLPSLPNASANTNVSATQTSVATTTQTPAKQAVLTLKTDVLSVSFSKTTGDILDAKLLDYPISVKEKHTPVQLFNSDAQDYYVAESGFADSTGEMLPITYQASIEKGKTPAAPITVTFTGQTQTGITLHKVYTLNSNAYDISANYTFQNTRSSEQSGYLYAQLVRRYDTHASVSHYWDKKAIALSTDQKPYEKIQFSHLTDKAINLDTKGGWVAMLQQYFLSAWIPDQSVQNHFYSIAGKDQNYTIGLISPQLTIPANGTVHRTLHLYVGPAIAERLQKAGPYLERAIDFGQYMWVISDPLLKIMKWIYQYIGNWGVAIILLTLGIKLLFYKLSEKSYYSMANMKKLQPKILAIKQRCGDDKQQLQKETMELYKHEKINPLGGCLPILVQIPVFLGLYFMLLESVELRQAPFLFWIQDLSAKDPYFILPVLMGFSMFLQQKLSPAPADATQAKIMMFMPLIFTVMFLQFPSGLVLYWLVNNLLSIAQQYYITRKIEKMPARKSNAWRTKKPKKITR